MNEHRTAPMGAWIAIGVGIGAAVGVATDNVGLWIPLGLVIGVVISAAMASRRKGDA
jgi:hypothetical protein